MNYIRRRERKKRVRGKYHEHKKKRIGAYVRFESSMYGKRRRKDVKKENVSYSNTNDFIYLRINYIRNEEE